MTASTQPQLCTSLSSFAAEDPGGWTPMATFARAADAAGIDCLMISDHVVFGEALEEYAKPEVGGSKGGAQPTGPDGHWLEPVTTIAWLAGQTSRVHFRTNILLAALRRPLVLAKMASTIDVLSGGRLALGVGVGWQAAEYEAAGLSFEGRGKLLDHAIEVCQTLWREQRANHSSDLLTFSNIHQMPKPLQPGGVPIWISGTFRNSTVRRLATYGARWIPWGPDAADIVNAAPRMREAVAKAGGDVSAMRIIGNLGLKKGDNGRTDVEASMERVGAMLEAGVTDFSVRLDPPGDHDDAVAYMEPLVAGFRAATGRG
ncbi:MAG: TIGR03619 family F420-dependent LLM class oxidoreductase [Alphaproteobacteria bacterium]|nr:TIGR03619 family F420-dependent LLM class oxidoreductase [Alphaproteobacteria bacterium]